eukprot:4876665-Pleurochrysis_carterae.AAC.1
MCAYECVCALVRLCMRVCEATSVYAWLRVEFPAEIHTKHRACAYYLDTEPQIQSIPHGAPKLDAFRVYLECTGVRIDDL